MATINLRVPDEVLVAIDEEAGREGLTRTALLLRPWFERSSELVAPKPRGPVAKAVLRDAEKRVGVVTKVDVSALNVPFGRPRSIFGFGLKKPKGGG